MWFIARRKPDTWPRLVRRVIHNVKQKHPYRLGPFVPFQVLVREPFVTVTYSRQISSPLIVQYGPALLQKLEIVGAPFRTRGSGNLLEPAEPYTFRPEQMTQGLEHAAVRSLEVASQLFGRKLLGGIEQSGSCPDVVVPMLLHDCR